MSRTLLAVGGHIGDMDLTAGPLIAKWVLEGGRAVMVACTYGERGHPRLAPSQYRDQKIEEGRRFAEAVGAELQLLDYSDGFLPNSDAVATQLAEVIAQTQPEIMITHWTSSMHSDHVHAARTALRARFLAALPDDAGVIRHSVPTVLHADNWEDAEGYTPDTFVEIPAAAFDRWRAAIEGEAFARGETYGFRYIDYYTAMMTANGCLAGVERALRFAAGHGEKFALAGP